MNDWATKLTSIGTRPSSLLRGVGWVVLAMLYSAALGIALGGVLSLLALLLESLFNVSLRGMSVALALWAIQCFGIAILMLVNSAGLPRLQWASWWLLSVDATLRMVSGIALMSGAPRLLTYGATGFIGYDFTTSSTALGLATAVGAAATFAALGVFAIQPAPATSHRTSVST